MKTLPHHTRAAGRGRRAPLTRSCLALIATMFVASACDIHTSTGPGDLAAITVSPNVTLAVGALQQFVAVGTDAEGGPVDLSPVWSVVAGGGTINSTGMFTAGTNTGVFTATVRATSGTLFGTATVTVVVGALVTIDVTPSPVTLEPGDIQTFVAVGRDAGNNVVPMTPVWSVTAGGGSINSANGLFTAGIVDGTYSNTVRATNGSIFGTATVIVASPPPLIPLGAAGTHGILAGSAITCVTLGTINADASVWPGSAFSGFPPCTITGQQHAADLFAQTAQGDLTTAYNALDGQPCGTTLTADLGGQTLQPGVYCSLTSQGLTGEMFLNALGDPNATFVIKAASTITTAGAVVTLLNGAQAKNVYWLSGSSVTLGVGSAMKGNILALTSITLVDNATLLGRALARNGAVSLGNNNTITLP